MARVLKRRASQAITIQHVARRARVSPMTVSRVANGGANVRERTRARVLRAIRELNYAPNPAARSLAAAQTTRVALIYTNPSAAYLSELLLGALEQAGASGVQLQLEQWPQNPDALPPQARSLAGAVAGIVLPPPLCESRALVAQLQQAGLAVVALAPGRYEGLVSCVRIDNRSAAREMTDYLLGLGHRRIGFLRGDPNQSASALRFDGFCEAMGQAGLKPQAALVRQGYFTYRSGLKAAEALLAQRRPPTAIFASNDDMATAVISVAHRRGLTVPGDLSVVGFDDTPIATTVFPELTTVRQPIAEMAAAAIALLLQQIRADRSAERAPTLDRLFAHRLIRRASAASPGPH